MPVNQLNSDNLKNIRQASVIHNFLDIFPDKLPAIKLILGQDIFFQSISPEFSRRKICVLQTKQGAETDFLEEKHDKASVILLALFWQ